MLWETGVRVFDGKRKGEGIGNLGI